MQRSSQFNGIKTLTQFLFESSDSKEDISELIKNRADETYNTYLKTEVFDIDIDNDIRTEEKILEKVSQVELLQDIVEQYLQKKQYSVELLENEYKGIALIYELCIKILQVVKSKLSDQYQLYKEDIEKGLIYNTLLCSIYYFCAREIGMGQMIAEFFNEFGITADNTEEQYFKYMTKLIDFFSLKRCENIGHDDIMQLFHDFSVEALPDKTLSFSDEQYVRLRDCLGPDITYLQKSLEELKKHSFRKYIVDQGGDEVFKGIEQFKIRFLLPGQLEVLQIIDRNNDQGVKSNIVTMPTSGGKSLIAELQIARKLQEHPDKIIIYIAPKVALCDQVTKALIEKFVEVVEESHDDLFDTTFDHSQKVLVLTPEKFLGMMSRDLDLDYVSLIVFDEFHNIATGDRGPKIELMMNILKLKKREQSLDIHILLMSAMIDNSDDVLHRLGEEGRISAKSEKSPTRKQLLYTEGDDLVYSKGIERSYIKKGTKTITNESFLSKLKNIEKVFIFRSRPDRIKTETQSVIQIFSDRNHPLLNQFANSFNDAVFRNAIKKGVGFFYRNMLEWQKYKMLDLYKSNILKVIIGNSTIIEGVNLDIDFLVIGDIVNLTIQDLNNMVGRSGRFPYQTDGFVFMDTENKPNKLGFIEQLFDLDHELKSGSLEQNATIKQYFLIRLSSIETELNEENINQIMQDFTEELKQYFIGYMYDENSILLNRIIQRIISNINLRNNFLQYQGYKVDSFYKITGMSPGNTKELLDKYDVVLKIHRSSTITEDSGYNLDDVLPESFYPITIEDKEITRHDRDRDNYKNYLLPWILSSYQRKVENDMTFEEEVKILISKKIKQCILRIKYKVHSLEALQIMKKYLYSAELSNLLVEYQISPNELTVLRDIISKDQENRMVIHEIEYHLVA